VVDLNGQLLNFCQDYGAATEREIRLGEVACSRLTDIWMSQELFHLKSQLLYPPESLKSLYSQLENMKKGR
jgi:hypothetical protein